MKIIKGTILSVSLILLLPIISIAEQRMITFEMGEGGHLISFPMTKKEIAAAKETDAVIEEIRERKQHKQQTWEHRFELAESGSVINFPMSPDEVTVAKAHLRKIEANHDKILQLQEELQKGYEIFEMGDSGQIIKFKWNSNE